MDALAEDIESAGYTPGIWLTPFHVAADSIVATEHPEWLISDEDGSVGAGFQSGDYLYGLDATHPEVRTWLHETFHTVVHEWGDDTFILGCGAPVGPNVGIVDAMRIGPDVDPVWEPPDEPDSQPALKNAVRNTLNRQFTHVACGSTTRTANSCGQRLT